MDNPNRMITKQDLADFYDTIYPYLGGMPEALANKFDKGNLYSTTEKMIGCWIDSRPLYQKTISCGALPNATTKTVAHNISNLREVISIRGWVSSNGTGDSATFSPIPFVSNGNTTATNASVACLVYQGYIHLTSFMDLTAFNNSYVTLTYTKSTDEANSFNYGDENDYSTDEKIIGTWVTGEPIYQKTVMINAVPSSGNTLWVQIEPTLDVVVDYSAIVYSGVWSSVVDSISTQDATSSSYFKVYVYNYKWTDNPGCAVLINNIVTAGWDDKKAFITVKYTKKTS